MTRKQVEKIRDRATSCLCTYSHKYAKLRVHAKDLEWLCNTALGTFEMMEGRKERVVPDGNFRKEY